ncbi:hypothetical protein F5887DRAFT_1283775 [Amanita rubescens]|nr:hypothetical protein F5887DRAFT_1283775 [Amanita rubescens]
MLSTIKVYIIAMTLEALLTGVYLTSFLLCLRWLIFSDDGETLRKGIHWPFFIITVIIFASSVTDLSLSLQTTLLVSQGASPTTKTVVYIEIINWALEMLTSITTDGVLVFRCWTVYNRSWRITVLPLLLLLFNISSVLVMTCWDAIYELTGNKPFSLSEGRFPMLASYFTATITINIYATSAIIFRIRRNSLSRRFSRFVIRVIAESGLLYTLTSIATFCTVFPAGGHNNGFSIASAISSRTAGIAFNLILIRVAQNRANPEPELPTFIGDSTLERVNPAAPCSIREGL